jgi:hypothetical protein
MHRNEAWWRELLLFRYRSSGLCSIWLGKHLQDDEQVSGWPVLVHRCISVIFSV